MSFLYEEENNAKADDVGVPRRLQISQQLERPRVRVTEEARTALSESIRIAAETNQLAQATATELQSQTEQIQRIHRDSEVTHDNLRTSEFLLKGMKGWWSSLTQLFQEPPKPRPTNVRRPPEDTNATNDVRTLRQTQVAQAQVAPQNEMSAGLSQLSLMLEEMKHRAIVTGRELEYQNQELEVIHELTSTNDEMLEKQRRDLERLMR